MSDGSCLAYGSQFRFCKAVAHIRAWGCSGKGRAHSPSVVADRIPSSVTSPLFGSSAGGGAALAKQACHCSCPCGMPCPQGCGQWRSKPVQACHDSEPAVMYGLVRPVAIESAFEDFRLLFDAFPIGESINFMLIYGVLSHHFCPWQSIFDSIAPFLHL